MEDEGCFYLNPVMRRKDLDDDSDGDGLGDGKEIDGYSTTISYAKNGNVMERTVWIGARNGNMPGINGLDPTDNRNRILDSDEDHLIDFDETNPEIRAAEDAAKDPKDKVWEGYLEGLTEKEMKNQFNPLVVENFAPKFKHLSITKEVKTTAGVPDGGYIKVVGTVFDITGIDYVSVKIKNDRTVFTPEDGTDDREISFNVKRELSSWEYLDGKYPVEVKASDVNGNTVTVEKEIKGVLQDIVDAFLDFLGDAWNAAVEIAAALASMVLSWLVKIVNAIWNAILKPIVDALSGYVANIIKAMLNYFKQINDFDWEGTSEDMPENFDVQKELSEIEAAEFQMTLSLLGLNSQAMAVMNAVQELLDIIQPFKSLLDPMGLVMLIAGSVPGINQIFGFLEDSSEFISDGIALLTKSLLSLFSPLLKSITLPSMESLDSLGIPTMNAILHYFTLKNSGDVFLKGILSGVEQWLEEMDLLSASRGRSLGNAFLGLTGILITFILRFVAKKEKEEQQEQLNELKGSQGAYKWSKPEYEINKKSWRSKKKSKYGYKKQTGGYFPNTGKNVLDKTYSESNVQKFREVFEKENGVKFPSPGPDGRVYFHRGYVVRAPEGYGRKHSRTEIPITHPGVQESFLENTESVIGDKITNLEEQFKITRNSLFLLGAGSVLEILGFGLGSCTSVWDHFYGVSGDDLAFSYGVQIAFGMVGLGADFAGLLLMGKSLISKEEGLTKLDGTTIAVSITDTLIDMGLFASIFKSIQEDDRVSS